MSLDPAPPVSKGNLLVHPIENGIARLSLNRPNKMNAIDINLADSLTAAIKNTQDSDGRVVLIDAVGPHFCTGADMIEMASIESQDAWAKTLSTYRSMYEAVAGATGVTIASIRGNTLAGGLELALACDLVIASSDAVLGDFHSNHDLIPGGGATVLLPRLVGERRAKYLLFTGKTMNAEEALAAGLVNEVVEPSRLDTRSLELATGIAGRPSKTLSTLKDLVDRPLRAETSDGRDREIEASVEYFGSPSFRDGFSRFMSNNRNQGK